MAATVSPPANLEGKSRPTTAPPKDAASHYDENGPDGSGMAPRRCTDVTCLLVFLVFLGGMGYVMSWALQNGNPRRLVHGLDFEGRLCGVDPGVETKPFLFWCPSGAVDSLGHPLALDLKSPICLSSCPGTAAETVPCSGPRKTGTKSTGTPPYLTYTDTIEYSLVPRTTYVTEELAGLYCIPSRAALGDLSTTLFEPNGPLGSLPSKGLEAVGTLHRCYRLLLGAALMAIVLGYVYLILLRSFAEPLVQGALYFSCLFFLVLSLACFAGEIFTPSGAPELHKSWRAHNLFYRQFDPDSARLYSNILGAVFGVIFLIVTCMLCAAQEMIQTAVGCIEASTECLFTMPAMLFQPLLDVCFKVLVYGSLLYGLSWLVSAGKMESSALSISGHEIGGLSRSFHHTNEEKAMLLYYCFGCLWLMELTNSIADFVISYSVVLWYYTPKPKGCGPVFPLARAFIIGITFHLGTLAFGAFLIATCRFIRAILMYIAREAKASGNQAAACCASCLACVVRCVQEFLEQLNKNAYIDVAITSNSFCTAAKDSFAFLTANGGTVLTLTGVCFVASFAGILAISGSVGAVVYYLVTTNERWTSDTSPQHVAMPEVVVAVAACLAGLVAFCFMVVFDHTSDTLLYTFVWNKEHGHNTVDKYATDSLVAITGYKKLEKKSGKGGGGGVFGSFTSMFWGSSESASEAETKPLVK
eukprot:TRINITY_DN26933_c0_g1_i1.p1 TRINITY_DN26933_c0_g1~~TRINITY_DN26933_c0_g1_i1.p1  ORF type:complete len:700 (-),score=135.14 TRINITY_DN26933_c0_g1_i1:39-2138(-)